MTQGTSHDVIVCGLGAMGSAACWQLAARGARVLGVDRHSPPHSLGSTHGGSRLIREAYYEHPSYVPLLRRAYELWSALERETGERLLFITGGLMIGAPEGELVTGALRSAVEHGIEHEVLSASDVRRRYPALVPDDHMVAILEQRAGFLLPEACVTGFLEQSRRHGAELRTGLAVTGWEAGSAQVTVWFDDGTVATAGRLVIAAGAWAGNLPGTASLPLQVERQVFHHFDPVGQADNLRIGACPVALWEAQRGPLFVMVPDAGAGVKIGIHHHGMITDPESVDRTPRPADEAPARELLARYIPAANGDLRSAAVCLYTNTPDHHFVLDFLDPDDRVVVASPCSGHGFKFAAVVGEIVAELALDGGSRHDLGLFSAGRFART